MIFALIGNQNCGKTTLFNQLTGSNQHVGNFPGVTVDKKEGVVRKHKNATVVDLPGIYSLSPYTSEEVVTRDFLIQSKPDAVINIVDATNIERNLYLTMQVIELNRPMVLALNMMDEVRANGNFIDVKKLQEELGIPVIPISASKNEGVEELIDTVIRVAQEKRLPERHDFCKNAVHRAIHSVAHMIEDHAAAAGIPLRFAATKVIEGDQPMIDSLKLSENELDIVGHMVDEMETVLGTDREAALADMRYSFIEDVCKKAVVKNGESKEQLRSLKIDKLLTHKILAIPLFLAIMMIIFWLTFGVLGSALSGWFASGVEAATNWVDQALTRMDIAQILHSLIIDGIFAGVGSVLSFLPTIVLLFFFLSILEDSGYMARVAFVMDKLLRTIGLSGRSFVPMLIGFGCSVPAIMATRTLSSERDRKMTILLTPFMSCSAKLPIYSIFTMAFFPNHRAIVMISLYVFGMLLAVLSGLVMKKTVFHGKPVPFVMELPAYRFPSLKSVLLHMWDKAKDFLIRAFTVIFIATIVIWLLQTLDFTFHMVSDSSESMLANIARWIAPVFAPLGFGDWRAVCALITGFSAKETVVSTFAVLTGASGTALVPVLNQMFTPLAAYSFLVFTLLYTPCAAAIAAVKREMGTARSALFVSLYQTGVAWLMAFLVFQIGSLLFA